MAVDWAKSNYDVNQAKEFDVQSGVEISEEGLLLMVGTGNRTVNLTSGAGTDRFLGIAISDNIRVTTRYMVVSATIPSTSAYTIQLASVGAGIPGSAGSRQCFVYDETGGNACTQHASVPADNVYTVTSAGLLTFHSADAGHLVTIHYRYTMSAPEMLALYGQSVNQGSYGYQTTANDY